MPVCEYHCNDCDHAFEKLTLQGDEDKLENDCPRCGSKNVIKPVSYRKFMSGSPFVSSCGSGDFS